jgi:heterodisulfide reductase subunit A-like polyferredoxin
MYATKQAIIAKEHLAGLEATVFFIDIRAQGKGFDRYYERARGEHGVRYVRSLISRVTQDPRTMDLQISYIDEENRFQTEIFDLVVLSVGLTPHAQSAPLAECLAIRTDRFGFSENPPLDTVGTSRPGIFAGGVFQNPKDIPETVTQASGAAAAAAALLSEARGTQIREIAFPEERSVQGEDPRIGVFICHCGINIAGVVDVAAVSNYARSLPGVAYADHLLFSCSTDSQEKMLELIADQGLNRIVVASCSPRTHEGLFRETLRKAGLNKYLFEMANIRDQCSWVHQADPAIATKKAKDLVRMAVARAGRLEPLYEIPYEVDQRALVVGGGIAGMTAALNLADQGFETFLVERSDRLGGVARRIQRTLEGVDVRQYLQEVIQRVVGHPRIRLFTDTELLETSGTVGQFTSVLSHRGEKGSVRHGAVVVATGGAEYRPREYGYGDHPRVLTQLELQEKLFQDPEGIREAGSVVMIQCVGSRDEEHPYCSRVCCSTAVNNALRLKEINPRTEVIVLYRDMRTYARKELYYKQAREAGVRFIRFEPERAPEVEVVDGRLEVRVFDQNLKAPLRLRPDWVALSAAIRPAPESLPVANVLKLPLDADGFFLEAHIKLRPLDFANAGMFLCGLGHGPKSIEESIAQAKGAASRAATVLAQKQTMVGGPVAEVDEELCVACLTCLRVCPFGVPRVNERHFAQIDPAACRGCGNCASACPQGAIQVGHFRDDQYVALLEAC